MASDQCSFLDRKCVRIDCGHLCGGILPDGSPGDDKKVPYWVVSSLWSHPVPVIETPTQQLSLFEPPKTIVWWLHYGKYPKAKRQWWVGSYYCKRGADWAIQNEKELGAYDVRVAKVSRKPGCKRKTIVEPYHFCE